MSNEICVCRLCGPKTRGDDRTKVKYGTRHYAHWPCGLARYGKVEFLNMLPLHYVQQGPFMALHDAGWGLDELMSYTKRREDAGHTASAPAGFV